MITLKRTNGEDHDFIKLCQELDFLLGNRHNDTQDYCKKHNNLSSIPFVVIAFDENNNAIGCGAIRHYETNIMEIKRMFVSEKERGKNVASLILKELESWAISLDATKCILETGNKLTEAIKLYSKNEYNQIPRYGPYINIESSICFSKSLL